MSEESVKIEIEDAREQETEASDAPGTAAEPKKTDRRRFQVSDRRFWVHDEQAVDRAAPPSERLPSYIEQLKARTEAAEAKLEEKLAQLETENEAFRARLRRDMENRAQQETLRALEGLLEVVDNLERALEAAESAGDSGALLEGVRLNLRLFLEKLKAAGIEPLELKGQPYDPHLAEAVGAVPVEDPEQDQTVVEVVQKGYVSGDQLLRPARVRVGQYGTGIPARDPE